MQESKKLFMETMKELECQEEMETTGGYSAAGASMIWGEVASLVFRSCALPNPFYSKPLTPTGTCTRK